MQVDAPIDVRHGRFRYTRGGDQAQNADHYRKSGNGIATHGGSNVEAHTSRPSVMGSLK